MSDLYHPVILAHSRKPHQFYTRADAALILDAYNPICGDDFHLYLDIVDDRLEKMSYHGYGCAVSKASTSLMVKYLEGLTRSDAQRKLNQFLAMIAADGEMPNQDLAAFSIAKNYPGRISCATLAWKALAEYLIQNA